ncbi:MAG: hypothetical protein Q8859_02530 [Bacteroidota bacterium]|nr:hypothetical protein [Bacteroidota bacterium]
MTRHEAYYGSTSLFLITMIRKNNLLLLFGAFLLCAFTPEHLPPKAKPNKIRMSSSCEIGTYGYDREFLKKHHVEIIELSDNNSKLILVPSYQGRVMTSACMGDNSYSFGWINYNLIESGVVQKHINAFGGEERMWIGPEGGQFSVFFNKGVKFDFENWFTPSFLDTDVYQVTAKAKTSASFSKDFSIENYSGTIFNGRLERTVKLLMPNEIVLLLHCPIDDVHVVGYESSNVLSNVGREIWTKESGLLSIWMLGMLKCSPDVTMVIPIKEGDVATLGPKVNDNYFGKIGTDRLKTEGNIVYFKADGKSRGKIGIPPLRATGFVGSYDSKNNILTILECHLPQGITDYVNSSWVIQENPFSGDALNAYNDGPLEDGSQMGPFYELESSSPAMELASGKSIVHVQRTYHLTGNFDSLDKIAHQVLGTSLDKISSAFSK